MKALIDQFFKGVEKSVDLLERSITIDFENKHQHLKFHGDREGNISAKCVSSTRGLFVESAPIKNPPVTFESMLNQMAMVIYKVSPYVYDLERPLYLFVGWKLPITGKPRYFVEVAFVEVQLEGPEQTQYYLNSKSSKQAVIGSISDTNRAKLTIQIEPYGGPPGIKGTEPRNVNIDKMKPKKFWRIPRKLKLLKKRIQEEFLVTLTAYKQITNG
ncbi:unnamed protein product [Rhizophagus irregularis]|nr:unnamed protein product [Rhizophagus irregularis]